MALIINLSFADRSRDHFSLVFALLSTPKSSPAALSLASLAIVLNLLSRSITQTKNSRISLAHHEQFLHTHPVLLLTLKAF
jgi:hypothetical protein